MALDSCGCDSINGTCADNPANCAGATINCISGFFNCDNNLANGCECGPTSQCDSIVPASCPAGVAGTCQHMIKVGSPCAADCQLNPTCDSSGACSGTMAPEMTKCAAPAGCADPAGNCHSGLCICAHPLDLAGGPMDLSAAQCTGPHCNPNGHGQGSCSMTTRPTAPASAWTLFALVGAALLIRRRRSA